MGDETGVDSGRPLMAGGGTTALPAASPREAAGHGWVSFAVLLAYCAVSFLYFGLRLLTRPGSQYVGPRDDPQIFIWSFAWLPHALLHWENPLVTHAIWAPSGVNLTWTTFVPGLALLFAPLTLTVGAIASYNVATVLIPALAAWTAFLLCRHLTRAVWPSLVGGFLFGFSSYMLGQQQGHPHMSTVFLVPLVALVVLRFLERELDGRGLVLRLGPLLALQLSFSTELTFTLTLALGGALVVAYALDRSRRRRIVSLLWPLAGAYALAAVIMAPFLYYAFRDRVGSPFVPPEIYIADVLNFVVPTRLELAGAGWAGGITSHFPGNDGENGAFLGLPVLAIVVLFAWQRWRTPGGRFLLAVLVLAAFFALGAELTVYGHGLVPLPWTVLDGLPVFNNVLTVRFALYTSLAAAVIVALWTASRPPGDVWRWLLPGLAMVMLVPNPTTRGWATSFSIPPFLSDRAYRTCLESGENILPLPVQGGGDSMLWQVKSDFRFRMAGGRIATTPPSPFMNPERIERVSLGYGIPRREADLLKGYIAAKGVTSVVVDKRHSTLWSGALDSFAKRQDVGGVLLYRVAGPNRPCP